MKYIQKAFNILWPLEIDTWKLGEPVPEWLMDRAGVSFMSGDGNITLKTRDTNKGGLEILMAGSSEALVRLKKKEDIVYFSLPSKQKLPPYANPIMNPFCVGSITEEQLKMLYDPLEE